MYRLASELFGRRNFRHKLPEGRGHVWGLSVPGAHTCLWNGWSLRGHFTRPSLVVLEKQPSPRSWSCGRKSSPSLGQPRENARVLFLGRLWRHKPWPAASISLSLLTVLHEFSQISSRIQAPLLALTSIFHPTWHHPLNSEAYEGLL